MKLCIFGQLLDRLALARTEIKFHSFGSIVNFYKLRVNVFITFIYLEFFTAYRANPRTYRQRCKAVIAYLQRLFAVRFLVRVTFKQPLSVAVGKSETLQIVDVIYDYRALAFLESHAAHSLLSV